MQWSMSGAQRVLVGAAIVVPGLCTRASRCLGMLSPLEALGRLVVTRNDAECTGA